MLTAVAEKFTVARALANALFGSAYSKSPDFFQGIYRQETIRICWAEGHVLEAAEPETYNPQWGGKWSLDNLPVAPPSFNFILEPNDSARLNSIRRALEGASEVVNACDAAQEGELIFDEIARYLGMYQRKAKISRLWLSDTTVLGMRNAWDSRMMHEDKRLKGLRIRAQTRAEADWLWGINLTRYATVALGDQMNLRSSCASIGRVRTPVQTLIADRCRAIQMHEPEPYWQGVLRVANDLEEICEAKLLAPPELKFGIHDTDWSERSELETRINHIRLSAGVLWDVVEGDVKEEKEYPPMPFDTTDLQRTANRFLNWTPKYTDKIAQSLYMGGYISYPRTDSNKIPEQMRSEVEETWSNLWSDWLPMRFPDRYDRIPQWSPDPTGLFADKTGDHYAIIPTGDIPPARGPDGNMTDQYALWQLITLRFIGAWLPPAKILATSRVFLLPYVAGEMLRALIKAPVVREANWLIFEDLLGKTRTEGAPLEDRMAATLLPVMVPPKAAYRSIYLANKATTPPEYFTYDMLLYQMEHHKLGTPATRGQVLEELIKIGYIAETQSKRLVITEDGERLITYLAAHGGESVCEAKLTAFWEHQLDLVGKPGDKGRKREDVLRDIVDQVTDLGNRMIAPAIVDEVVFCPKTGLRVEDVPDGYRFAGWPDIICKKVILGRAMKKSEYRDIFQAGSKGGGPFEGFESKKEPGTFFPAFLVFSKKEKRFNFLFKRRKK